MKHLSELHQIYHQIWRYLDNADTARSEIEQKIKLIEEYELAAMSLIRKAKELIDEQQARIELGD